MANVAKISVELNLDDGSFTANMAKAAGAIEGFKRQADGTAQTLDRMERALGSFDGAMRGGLSRLAPMLGGWAVQTVRANVEMERMTAILKRFSTASTAAAREQEVATSQSWLSRMAKSAPYDITTLTAAFAALRAGGIDPTDGSLQALADSMAATGSGSQGLQRVSVAIQQMAADGKVSMDELRQLTGTVPDAMSLMARSMGLSVSELASRVSSGTVEAGSALGAMFAEMERTFGGSAQQLMSTFGGQLALLQTNIQGLQTGAGSKAFFDALTAGLTDLNTLLAGPIAQQWADDFGYAMAGVIGYGGVLMQAAVEWRHEILALGKVLAIVFAARTVASGVSGMTAAFSGAVAQIRQMGSVSSTYYTWANRTANVVGLKTMAQYRLAASVGVTAAAMRGLRMVMSTMLGPVGIAIGLLLELAHAAGFLTDQSARAVEDIGNGLISERAVEIVKKRRGELENEIEELKSKIQSDSEKLGKIGPDNVDGTSAIEGLIATSKAELRKADEELKVVKEALEKAAPEILRRSVEGLTAPTIAAMTDELEDVQGRYTMAMSDFQKQISDPLNADDDRQKEINAKRLDSTRKYTEDSLRILDKYIEQAKEKSESSDPAIKRAGERMLAEFHQRRLDLMREVGQEVQAADAPDIPDTFANLQDASLGQGEDEATRAYNSLINKQKELEAQADRVRKALGSDDTEIDPLGLKALQAELDGTLTQLKGYPEEAKAKLFSTDVRRDNAVVKMGDLAMDLRNKTRDMNFAMVDDPQLRSQMELQHEEQRVERMLSLLQGEGAERKLIEEDVQNYLQALRERAERNSETSAQRVAREWSNVNQRLRDAGAGWMNEFSNMLMDFVKTGKLKFSEFAEHILLEIIRIRMESMIAKPLSSLIDAAIGWLGGAIGGLSTGSEAPKISAPTPLVPSIPTVAGPPTFGIGYIYHAGGIVSRDTRPLRLLDPALFAGAGRFHGGGFPGLRSDEVPIIARKGEGVFTPEQMRALGGRGGGSDVTLNIINQTGTTVQAEQQGQRFDGERMILDVVLKHAARPGQFRDAMKGAFG